MSSMTAKTGKPLRREFTAEYKAGVVQLCRSEGKTCNRVARELGLSTSVVSRWVRQAAANEKGPGVGALTDSEREELRALRREVRTLRQEKEILKRATAFFVREGT